MPPKATFYDNLWRWFQGSKLSPLERTMARRALRALAADDDGERVLSGGERIAVLPGERLVEQGQSGDEMYLVLEGELQVRRDGAELERLGPGQLFGEMGLLDGQPRSATVEADQRCHVLRIPRELVDEHTTEGLWSWAAERRMQNLPSSPVGGGREREVWMAGARHAVLEPGEWEPGSPWLFLYTGSVELEGERIEAPALFPRGAFTCADTVRLVLLPEP